MSQDFDGGGYFGGGWGGFGGPSGGVSDISFGSPTTTGGMDVVGMSGFAYGTSFTSYVAQGDGRSGSQVLNDGAWMTGSTAAILGTLAVIAAPEITIPIAVAAGMAGATAALFAWAATQ